jgi:hypothetical protein
VADVIDTLLSRCLPRTNEHLSDHQLADVICNRGRSLERWIAKRHLAKCRGCRTRKDDLEGPRASRALARYDELFDEPVPDAPPHEQFIQRLRRHREQLQRAAVPVRKQSTFGFPNISLPEFWPMNPALVTCMVFGFATLLSFCFWWQQRVPKIGENALLVRAEKWDRPASEGVVYQTVRITLTKQTKKETVARSIYRDVQGKRQPKQVKLNNTEEQLRSTLTEAGLDWDEPLSASGYQSWHDRQHIREDHIARAGNHLLRLTTTVPDGLVAEQSLTVRDTDFHPVQRTVELRDSGTVEIAELDFKVLPWNAVDANAFEPLSDTPSIATFPARVLPFPRLPAMPTETQLDEAELGARLLLNQLHADSGEPIEIHRSAQGVTVDGLVETEKRRRELQAGLQTVPNVIFAVQSDESLKANPSPADAVQSIAVASMPDQPSPLETYLEARGRSIAEISDLAQQLLNNALTISQESKDLVDLQTRFGPTETKSVLASATLSELVYSHHERLEAALKRGRELLADAQSTSAANRDASPPKASSLIDAANRNFALSKELTQTNKPAVRTAEQILAEMSITMNDLTATAQAAYGKSQGNSALSGKK